MYLLICLIIFHLLIFVLVPFETPFNVRVSLTNYFRINKWHISSTPTKAHHQFVMINGETIKIQCYHYVDQMSIC